MGNKFADIAFTDSVKEMQELMGSRKNYERMQRGPAYHNKFTDDEIEFIKSQDSFYMASVGETGWPYIQHRGGPKGFMHVISENQMAFADYAGNRQYISVGNLKLNNKAAFIFVDYKNKARLKILGHAEIISDISHPEILSQIASHDYKAKVERGFLITLEAFDWNCPQHITQRWTAADISKAVEPLKLRIKELEDAIAQRSD